MFEKEAREKAAQAIYDLLPFDEPTGSKPQWIPGGNSLKQDEARRYAHAALQSASASGGGEEHQAVLMAGLLRLEEAYERDPEQLKRIRAAQAFISQSIPASGGWETADCKCELHIVPGESRAVVREHCPVHSGQPLPEPPDKQEEKAANSILDAINKNIPYLQAQRDKRKGHGQTGRGESSEQSRVFQPPIRACDSDPSSENQAERDAWMHELNSEFRAGAEWMRERIEAKLDNYLIPTYIREAIAALPLEPEEKP